MALFTLTDTIKEFKCASGKKKTLIDPNGGQIQIDAKWGSQQYPEEGDDAIIIDKPKYLWSSGYKMPVTLTLVPPGGKFVEDDTVEFKAGGDDFVFKAKWLDTAPVVAPQAPVDDAFGESNMSKPVSPLEQLAIDVKEILAQNKLILGALGDLINE